MSKEDIERKIRFLFYLLFGVTFTFLFIFTSSYLELVDKSQLENKERVKSFIIDGIKTRERFIFEEYMSKNYNSISLRVSSFLQSKNIQNFEIVVSDSKSCIWGSTRTCEVINQFSETFDSSRVSSLESLGKLYILVPVIGWDDVNGLIGVEIPLREFSSQQTFIKKLLFHVLPFLIVFAVIMAIYFYTERNLIKPTIKKIIDSEKLQLQKDMMRQFAHDIRSPIIALEEVLESNSLSQTPTDELIVEALERIKGISNDLLDRERVQNNTTNIPFLINSLVKDKKLEFKSLIPEFNIEIQGKSAVFLVNQHELYRSLSNLINNSIESVDDDKKPEINLKVIVDDVALYIEIKDNGAGISSEILPLIASGSYTSKREGNALGIRGVKKWLSTLKGSFEIESLEGSGTKVLITIPS